MNEVVERLRMQKKISKHRWFENGRYASECWSEQAHYEEIQMVINSEDIIPFDELIEFDHTNEDWFDEMVFGTYPLIINSEPWKYFMLGFIKGVQEFWDEIKDKI